MMKTTAVVTDSNSGITQAESRVLGVHVIPMPFYVGGELFYEDISLTQEGFYRKLEEDVEISTSMPSPGDVLDLWDTLLEEYEEIVYIPMSSGLSSSYMTAMSLAEEDDYEGRVFVIDNQRISVTQRQSVLDAQRMAQAGYPGARIREQLEKTALDASIYITVDTLKYLKKGGRITPSAAALGTLLRIKPVLQIQGGKLDAFSKCRTLKQAKTIMLDAIGRDLTERFGLGDTPEKAIIAGAYTCDEQEAMQWKEEIGTRYPGHEIIMQPLSLSVACHIGAGALAVTVSRPLEIE